MFDVGFSELLVIAIAALVVIGPERLPKVARTIGLLFGRAQSYVKAIKTDIGRELQLDELKQLQGEMQVAARHLEKEIAGSVDYLGQSVDQAKQSVLSATQKK